MSEETDVPKVKTDGYVYEGTGLPPEKLVSRIEKHKAERAEYGYSWWDWISFDTFLAGVIANGVHDFRVNGHGRPGDMTDEEWDSWLESIETPLRKYAEDKFNLFGEDEKNLYQAVQEAMHKVADRFGTLWD